MKKKNQEIQRNLTQKHLQDIRQFNQKSGLLKESKAIRPSESDYPFEK